MSTSQSTSTLSDAAVASNRINARKSTGPRTPRGKAVAAANALRHGLFARDLLLVGESADELLTLKTGMIQRLDPRDPLELEIVERVVASLWKIRRLQRFERLIYQQQAEEFDDRSGYEHREAHGLGHREPIPAEVAWQTGGEAFQQQLVRIENHQHRLENALHRSLRQLEKLRKQEADSAPGWFAEDALAAERRQHEKWRNEAADAESLTGAAQLADAALKREQLRIDREEKAYAEEQDDDGRRKPTDTNPWVCTNEPHFYPQDQRCPRRTPDQNWQNEAADAEQNEPAVAFDHPRDDISDSNVAETFESGGVPRERELE